MTAKQQPANAQPRKKFFSLGLRIHGLLIAAGLTAATATVLGFLGSFWWFFELFSHFRVQYALGLTVVGALLLLSVGRRRIGAFFLGLACVNALFIAPLYFGDGAATVRGDTLRILLINVNTRLGEPEKVRREVQRVDPDVVVLIEINRRWVEELAWLADSHKHTTVDSREDNFGIGVFSKNPLENTEIVYLGSSGAPSILADVELDGQRIHLLATHPLPPTRRENALLRNEQLRRVAEYAREKRPLVLVGDLNTSPWSPHFRRLVREGGLQNSARGYGIQASWPRQSLLFRIPIDHCLHSAEIAVVARQIGHDVGSDHFPVIVELGLSDR